MEIQTIQSAIAGVRRINEFFELPVLDNNEELQAEKTFDSKNDTPYVQFNDVTFGYEADHTVIAVSYTHLYQYGLKEMGIMYVINFLLSVIPLDFLQTWVYVKNNRSMLATIIFHLFINIMQEKINMTPETKCIQTIFVVIAAIIIVVINKEMFFETQHVGNLLEERCV